jgi:protein gp37
MKSPDLDPVQASSYDYGWTWNPITGCLNHVNGLCRGGNFPCYAYGLAKGRCQQRYLGHGELYMKGLVDLDPFYPRFWPERLKAIRPVYHKLNRWGEAECGASLKGIFVCDMSDLFGIGVPETWTKQVLDVIRNNGQDRFYLLTKQPQNLVKFPPPDNCWVGVTATNQPLLTVATDYLGIIEASVKFLSFEPLLGNPGSSDTIWQELKLGGVSWVIIGAQTKPVVYPRVEWVKEIVEACDKAGVKVFLKDNLGRFLPRQVAEQPGNLYPKDGWYPLRQEMPVRK